MNEVFWTIIQLIVVLMVAAVAVSAFILIYTGLKIGIELIYGKLKK